MAGAVKYFSAGYETGMNLYCIIERDTDGYYLNDADGAFANAPADPYVAFTENGTIKGKYELSESRAVWNNGYYTLTLYKRIGGSPAPVDDTILSNVEIRIADDLILTKFAPSLDTVATVTTASNMVDISNLALESTVSAVRSSLTTHDSVVQSSLTSMATEIAAVKSYSTAINTGVVTTIPTAVTSVGTQVSAVQGDVTNIVAVIPATVIASKSDITDLHDFDPALDVVAHVTLVDSTTVNTDMVDYTAQLSDIKAKTDFLAFTGTDVHATITDKTGYSLTADYDAAKEAATGTFVTNLIDALPTAAEIDAQLSGSHGAGSWEDGSVVAGSFTVTITVDDGTNPILDVSVTVRDSTDTVFIGHKYTNSSGVVTFSLDNGTYKVGLRRAGYSFTVPETLVVSGVTSDTFSGTELTVTAPGVQDTCRVYEYFVNPDLSIPEEIYSDVSVINLPLSYSGALVAGSNIPITYNATTGLGYWDIVYGATVKVGISDFMNPSRTIVVPSETTVQLSTLI